ncbi:MAG: transporter substrate-binding domain-containing protein [Lachnospiraceae bacterium]|nr:transporter substrate-binding domain-containing protein [Lachnospiraceae bacterium]
MKKTISITLAAALAASSLMMGGCSGAAGANAAQADNGKTEAAAKPANRLEEILQRGYLEVATEPYFAPYEFIDSSKKGDEQYVGSDIEMAKYIADKLGVELKIVPLEFAAVLSSITEGKYDLAISALAYTPARAEAMNLSNGYRYDDEAELYGLLVKEDKKADYPDAASLKDAVVVCQSGSLQELFVTEQIPECKEVKRVSATTDGFLMVSEGKADVAATEITTAELYAAQNPGVVVADNFRFTVDESTQGTRIGIPKGETELTDRINEIIGELVESRKYDKWYEEYGEYAKTLGVN